MCQHLVYHAICFLLAHTPWWMFIQDVAFPDNFSGIEGPELGVHLFYCTCSIDFQSFPTNFPPFLHTCLHNFPPMSISPTVTAPWPLFVINGNIINNKLNGLLSLTSIAALTRQYISIHGATSSSDHHCSWVSSHMKSAISWGINVHDSSTSDLQLWPLMSYNWL